MNDQIVLSPSLDLTPSELAEAWNDTSDYAQLAHAQLSATPGTAYTDPTLLTTVITLAGTVSIGVATNALYDVLKHALLKKGVKKHTKITTLDQPDGTHLFVIETEEE